MFGSIRRNGPLLAFPLLLSWGAITGYPGSLLADPPRGQAAGERPGFVVVDEETSQPIRRASVRIVDPFDDDDETESFSDARGRAVLLREFALRRVLNEVTDGKRFKVHGWRVKVSADGYEPSTTPLLEHMGEVIDLGAPKVTQPVVRLRRRQAGDQGQGPAAGTYVAREGYIGLTLVLHGDRFDALRSCPKICSEHTPWFETKHGVVARSRGALKLRVQGQELLPVRDGKEETWLPTDLVSVRWGRREYLIGEGELLAFCNAVNQGEEPRDSEYGFFLLGVGQEDAAVSGLPDVPATFGQYLLKEPINGVVTELLPDLRARVNVGRKQGLRAGMELVPTEKPDFSDMAIVHVEEGESVVKTKYPNGTYREIRVGDLVSTRRPPSRTTTPPAP
ncbi:hypothetical protein OJF2_76120 [Aquisphaera giovannonii]|uniref:Uncharacterized protein n=1 Tax=Aquisphaera giovannonii TaxID=406548 RepID=A0A5B9WGN1_9BACT|nr:hypothetical protein [Aquisphaera giovannonii]QEH39000.1 hypothetical protein OJF2_76120 [Aquisphaera giovannonii]